VTDHYWRKRPRENPEGLYDRFKWVCDRCGVVLWQQPYEYMDALYVGVASTIDVPTLFDGTPVSLDCDQVVVALVMRS
jgi:hypothetical protein